MMWVSLNKPHCLPYIEENLSLMNFFFQVCVFSPNDVGSSLTCNLDTHLEGADNATRRRLPDRHLGNSASRSRRGVRSCAFSSYLFYIYKSWTKRTANPASNAEELAHYISVSGSTIIVSHPDILLIAVKAAQQTDIPSDRIVLLGTPEQAAAPNLFGFDLHGLIAYGLSERTSFTERRLEPGEAKRKIGLLVFSSGTTGKPKVWVLPLL
jgi:hypothetical protein